MRKWDFRIKKMWLLEILGGAFFAIFIRWTEVVFMTRNFFLGSSNWSGLAGPEYIAMILGCGSRLGAGIFTLLTALTGGIDAAQMTCTLTALGLWEWQTRERGSSRKIPKGIWNQIRGLPIFWPLVALLCLGWLSLQFKNVV